MTSKPNAKRKHGVFTLFSWVFTTLAGAYVGALVTFLPPPKALLCKLSLGYCQQAEEIRFLAVDADLIQDKEGVGQAPGEAQIGMLHNDVSKQNANRPNMVQYKFEAKANANYYMRIYYASADERIVDDIIVNDVEYEGVLLGGKTSGWNNSDREWTPRKSVALKEGVNTIMLRRESVFPHISKFEFIQIIE